MHLRYVVWIGDMAEIDTHQVFRARGTLAPCLTICHHLAVTFAATFDMVRLTKQTLRSCRVREPPHGCLASCRDAGQCPKLPDAVAEPISIENVVESLPIEMGCAEQ